MATIWERLFGSRSSQQLSQVSNEIATMRSTVENLANYNSTLQSLLAVQFRQAGGFTRFDTNNQVNYIQNGYDINADIYSVVSDIAQKGASIPLVCYEVIDDNALKSYITARKQRFTSDNIILTNKLRTKALRQVEQDNPIQKIIDQPNPDDDADVFYQTSIGFTLLCGNNFWYSPRLDMGADKGKVVELRLMPSQFTGLIIVQGFPARVIGYQVIVDGATLLQSEDVIHMRFPNYNWSIDGQQLYGLPPLKAGLNLLNLSNAVETSQISSFNNGGPAMIIANKTLPNDALGLEQAGRIKKMWNDEYSGSTNRNKVKLMAGDINAIPLGLSPVDLDIISADERIMDKICNLYKVSSVLFNNHSASTESNVQQMIRDSWVRGVLPHRMKHAHAFNRNIVPAYSVKGKRYFVDMDLSGIQDLQPDKLTQAQWLKASDWLTPNEKRKVQDLEELPDDNMNKIYYPQGYVALDDLNIDVATLLDMPDNNANDNTANT